MYALMSTKGVSTVAGEDSGKLVKHIDEAKDWLDKAKQEYTHANPIRGELILNLAQAEIKYAWELSHVRFVSQNNDQGRRRSRNFRSGLVLPIAAAVLIVLAASLLWFQGRNPLKPQTVALIEETTAENEPSGVLTEPTSGASKPTASNQVNEKSLGIGAKPAAIQAVRKLLTKERPPEVEPKLDSISDPIVQGSLSDDSIAPAEDNGGTEKRNNLTFGNNQSNLQPASQLTIDVDALTLEATHSLRNGK